MANTLILKQSADAEKAPTTGQLRLGELAVNTYDGRLFTKKNVSGAESIVEFINSAGGTLTGNLTAPRFISNVAQGTAPLTVSSTTVCTNLNADLVDGLHESTIVHGGGNVSASVSAPVTWSSTHSSQYKSGFWDINGASWTPDTGWWWGITLAHASNSSSYLYGGQLAIRNDAGHDVFVRHLSGGASPAAGPWHRIWTSGSDGSGSGLDADLLDGYHVGTSGSTIPRLDTANTWSTTQTSSLASGGNHVLLWNGVNTRTVIHRTDAAQYYVMLSDANAAPSGTYNALRPLRINLTSGLAAMENGLQVWGLTAKDAATFDAGLVAYSATNDYTTATVKLGYATGTYLAIHGGTSGNFVTHYVPDASSTPFQIDLKTQTKSWKFEYAVTDGFLIPGQGIRWLTTTGTGAPTVTTRSAGTRAVIYPSLSGSAVDYAFGYNTNTLWQSIPQTSGCCYKKYAGTTPIAVLGGDGALFSYCAGPAVRDTTTTLSAADIRGGLVASTPATGITHTLPTGTNMDDALLDVNLAVDWSVINLASDITRTVTVAGNTGHTIVGNAVVGSSSSARFRTRKTAANTFITYRIN